MTTRLSVWLCVAGILAPSALAGASERRGKWTASHEGAKVHLRLDQGPRMSYAFSLEPDRLTKTKTGLALQREAGRFDLAGAYDGTQGGGRYLFVPDPAYRRALEARGLALPEGEQMHLAALDVTLAFIDGLRDLGYDETLDRFVEMRIHGATPRYVRELASLGFDRVPSRRLVDMRIHGLTADYVRRLRTAGFAPTADELVDMKIHGVRVAFLEDLKALGLRDLTARNAIEMRIHGVTRRFIEALFELGYRDISVRDLIDLRIHGARPAWIAETVARFERRPSVRRLVELRIHGR